MKFGWYILLLVTLAAKVKHCAGRGLQENMTFVLVVDMNSNLTICAKLCLRLSVNWKSRTRSDI